MPREGSAPTLDVLRENVSFLSQCPCGRWRMELKCSGGVPLVFDLKCTVADDAERLSPASSVFSKKGDCGALKRRESGAARRFDVKQNWEAVFFECRGGLVHTKQMFPTSQPRRLGLTDFDIEGNSADSQEGGDGLC